MSISPAQSYDEQLAWGRTSTRQAQEEPPWEHRLYPASRCVHAPNARPTLEVALPMNLRTGPTCPMALDKEHQPPSFPDVLARFSSLAVALSLACSIGLHWTFLQAVAWSNMVASYSKDLPFSEAVARTLDGKHPCKLCKEIASAKRSEKKSDTRLESKKLEF